MTSTPDKPEPGLREHVTLLHARLRAHGSSDNELARAHAREHFQHGSATHHHGPDAGPYARPRGWRDGSRYRDLPLLRAGKPGVTSPRQDWSWLPVEIRDLAAAQPGTAPRLEASCARHGRPFTLCDPCAWSSALTGDELASALIVLARGGRYYTAAEERAVLYEAARRVAG